MESQGTKRYTDRISTIRDRHIDYDAPDFWDIVDRCDEARKAAAQRAAQRTRNEALAAQRGITLPSHGRGVETLRYTPALCATLASASNRDIQEYYHVSSQRAATIRKEVKRAMLRHAS